MALELINYTVSWSLEDVYGAGQPIDAIGAYSIGGHMTLKHTINGTGTHKLFWKWDEIPLGHRPPGSTETHKWFYWLSFMNYSDALDFATNHVEPVYPGNWKIEEIPQQSPADQSAQR